MLSATGTEGRNRGLKAGQAENIDGSSLPPRREAGKAFGKRSKGLDDKGECDGINL